MTKKRSEMTPEELEKVRTYYREYHRQYRAKFTDEQRETRRRYQREAYAKLSKEQRNARNKVIRLRKLEARLALLKGTHHDDE